MYNVTSFKANSAGKRAFSPYNDNTFYFKTFQVETLEGILREASQNFILNIPLNKSVRTFRRKENAYVFDFDPASDIKNSSSKLQILSIKSVNSCCNYPLQNDIIQA